MADERSYNEKIATASLLVTLETRTEEQREALRDEELLDRAGFDAGEIANLLGKNAPAVRMTLSRARAKKS
jgi:DNA-directed RNA polymerase specialized sigma24 family protein